MLPIEKNRNYIIDITDMTHEGQGVGRVNGMAVFVDGALEGEQVEARIIKSGKTYAVGKLISVIRRSPHRTEPFCAAYRRCGGCSMQHMDYAAQLQFKTKLVKDTLLHIGGLKDINVHDTIGMRQPFNYRNKAQYPVAYANGSVITGFYAARSHDVIDSEECGIQDPAGDRVRKIVGGFINEKSISVYNEAGATGLVRHIVTRVGFKTGEVMVVLVINGDDLPYREELVKRLVEGIHAAEAEDAGLAEGSEGLSEVSGSSRKYEINSIYLNVNTENTNVIMGCRNILIYGSETITDTIGDYKFMISPNSFFQVNPAQTEILYSKALEYAGLTGTQTVFDLYCGIGTISLFLSAKAHKVYGVEVVEEAVVDARRNAAINSVNNVEFIWGEAEKAVPLMYNKGIRADVVVLDPPRKGCEESLLRLIAEMRPKRIVYVSCNPATLARDLKYLAGQGYTAAEAQPVDMFPWTGHVETVCLLSS